MKTNLLLAAAACGSMFLTANSAQAQETVVVEETTVAIEQPVECNTQYSTSWRDNWFIQAGAGVQVPFTDKYLPSGEKSHRHATPVYNIGFGHWFSPYLGFRVSGMYGKMKFDFMEKDKAQMVTANADLMWDMTTSCCGVNPKRVFSFIPFVGVGGTYTWDFKGVQGNIRTSDLKNYKEKEWTLPVSVGFQMRFRLCDYVDFFAEARAQFVADNFNSYVQGDPIEADISAIGGLSFNIGARKFTAYNPCDYLGYINDLNNQVNNLRADLAATATALAVAESQLPCPDAQTTVVTEGGTPMLTTVRFTINSANITSEEMVNVYNVAEYLKANPNTTVTIAGYADKDTGTSAYNQQLSERRAQAVKDALVNDYGISADRLKTQAYGSATQPYGENNWNRIVIFTQP